MVNSTGVCLATEETLLQEKKTSLLAGGTRTQVLAESMVIAASVLNQ